MNKKLFVANLAYSITEAALKDLFAVYGEVVSVKIVTDTFTGKSKGFGFVEMGTKEEAGAAVTALNNKDCEGRSLKVDYAKPREAAPRGDRPFGGDRGGSRFGGDRGGDRGGSFGPRKRF